MEGIAKACERMIKIEKGNSPEVVLANSEQMAKLRTLDKPKSVIPMNVADAQAN